MHSMFPHLFSPIRIGSVTLRNRIISAPSSQADIENDGTLGKYNIAYYGRKAKGGAAMVTVGDGIVHPTGQDHPTQVFLYTDACLPSLMRCAEEIHKYGALASFELSHGGIVCNPEFIGGQRPYGPSEVPVSIGFQTHESVEISSQELTEEMMFELADAYASAAARVKKAGFDMVLVHGAHGWLISQFFSPNINKRTDKYGGSVENRCRFAILVLERIRAAVGPQFPINFRINGDDAIPEGLHSEEAVEICKILEPYVDAFHVSGSVHYVTPTQDVMQTPIYQPHGHLLPYAEMVKKAMKRVPVITVGGFSDLTMMEETVAAGKADIIALGRQLLADPDIVKKGLRGRPEEVRRCLRCATCQSHRFTMGAARCAVNPEIGMEYEVQFLPPAPARRKVLIAGGGPGGMEAAIIAARRGHEVTLYEKETVLGGALNFAEHIPFKAELYGLIQSMEAELRRLPVRLVMGTALTPALAELERADVIIAAVGGESIRPPFPGIDQPLVVMAEDVDKGAPVGKRVAVIGGGLVGCETAIHLAGLGKQVTVVEMAPRLCGDANFRYLRTNVWEMEKRGVTMAVSTKCSAITDKGVSATGPDGEALFIEADTVVIAVGVRPLTDAAEELRPCAPEFFAIGNCVRPGQVHAAIRSGYQAAMYLD